MTALGASLAANLYFGIFILVGAFGLIFGYFTVRGSGINNHPSDGRGAAPGAKLPDEFHQFEDRQIHDADVRHAAHATTAPPQPAPAARAAPAPADDMTIDDVNRRLAAEAAARKASKRQRV